MIKNYRSFPAKQNCVNDHCTALLYLSTTSFLTGWLNKLGCHSSIRAGREAEATASRSSSPGSVRCLIRPSHPRQARSQLQLRRQGHPPQILTWIPPAQARHQSLLRWMAILFQMAMAFDHPRKISELSMISSKAIEKSAGFTFQTMMDLNWIVV